MSTIIKVEYDGNFRIIEFTDELGDTYILEGKCSYCGKCCTYPKYNAGYNDENGRCTKLKYETVDGIPRYLCSIYGSRPISCMLWPTSIEEISTFPECTLKLRKK